MLPWREKTRQPQGILGEVQPRQFRSVFRSTGVDVCITAMESTIALRYE
jgi:hypothetical protein